MKFHRWHASRTIQVGFLITLLIAPTLLLFNSCSDKPSAPALTEEQLPIVDPQIVAWLQENALPFQTSKPRSGFEDITYLKDLVGTAHIVALGEATHGTKEFFEMKHRIFEYLVTQMGFTMFAIEANWSECNFINDYVHGSQADPKALLSIVCCQFWYAQEVLDLILWMRQYNQSSGTSTKLSFYGFDFQYPHRAMDSVVAYLNSVDVGAAGDAVSLYAVYRPYQDYPFPIANASSSVKSACTWNVQTVYERLVEHQQEYEQKSSVKQYAMALRSARIVVQSELYALTQDQSRDAYMAENVRWLINQGEKDAKIVLWAHNLHVGIGMGGLFLRSTYGNDLRVFGFAFYKGSFNVIRYNVGLYQGFGKQDSDIPPEDSYEYAFRATGIPRFFLDMREYTQSTTWIAGPLKLREVGNQYDQSLALTYYYDLHLPRVFDVVIYFQDTNASAMLF